MTSVCFLCQKAAPESNTCQFCENIFFCSNDHFSVHRGKIASGNDKKDVCWPFRIENRPIVGNIMVASRDIKATEIVLEEYPAAWGPNCKSKPVCLECLRPWNTSEKESSKEIPDTNGIDSPLNRCKKCNFPLCKECENGPSHQSECPVLANWKDLDLPFDKNEVILEQMCILPLRLLNLSSTKPELSNRVDLLMDHLKDLKAEEIKIWEDFVVKPIRESCGYEKYSKDQLLRAIGIITTNSVNQGILLGQAIYPTFSFISHNCVNNSRFQIHQDRKLVLRTQIDVKAGEEITTLYLPPILGNIRRRAKILHSWKFECNCERCKDNTEFGSMLDAIACQKCKSGQSSGFLLPVNSLDPKAQWQCNNCSYNVDGLTVGTIIKGLEEESNSIKELNPETLEKLVESWSSVLHPTHFILVTLKKKLLDIYRLTPEPEDPCELRRLLERQIELGLEQLKIADIIQPGYSLRRGRILRLIHSPTLKLAKLDLTEKIISKDSFIATTKLCIARMKESIKCMEDFGPLKSSTKSVDLASSEGGMLIDE